MKIIPKNCSANCPIVLVQNCPFLLCWCQIVRFTILGLNCLFAFLVPNCPFYYLGAILSDAKLSGCQIVRCHIALPPTGHVSHCPGEHPDGSWDLQNSVLVYLVLWLVCLMSLALDGVSVTFGTSKIYVIGICIAEN